MMYSSAPVGRHPGFSISTKTPAAGRSCRSPLPLVNGFIRRGQIHACEPSRKATVRFRQAHICSRWRQRTPGLNRDLGFSEADRGRIFAGRWRLAACSWTPVLW